MNCYLHPSRPAVGTCVHCGNFICDVCDVVAGGQHYCKACLQRMGPYQPFGIRRFTRSRQDRIFAGVCGGLARYFGLDPTLVRVLFAIGALFTGIVPFIVVYLVLAIVAPEDEVF